MKILHSSDWHLGVDYQGAPRIEEQAAFLTWMLRQVEVHDVDAVIVAGDIFDNGAPSAEAQALYFRFLAQLGSMGGKTAVVVGGNHDSASRLDAPREVLSALSTHVVGGYSADREGQGPLAFKEGVLVPLRVAGEVRAVVAAVPFLHDWRIGLRDLGLDPGAQHAELTTAFRGVYARLADAAMNQFPGLPLLATGHLTCLPSARQKPSADDAIPHEINRVGTLGAFGPDVFDARFDYVALGHIHRGFAVDAGQRVWYSGTPVQVSRTEPADARRVLLVDTASKTEHGGLSVTPLAVPVTRRLVHVQGTLDEVIERLRRLSWDAAERPPLVSVEAVCETYKAGVEQTLRDAAPEGANGRAQVVESRVAVRAASDGKAAVSGLPNGADITPEAAFRFAWRNAHSGTEPPEIVLIHFRALLESEV